MQRKFIQLDKVLIVSLYLSCRTVIQLLRNVYLWYDTFCSKAYFCRPNEAMNQGLFHFVKHYIWREVHLTMCWECILWQKGKDMTRYIISKKSETDTARQCFEHMVSPLKMQLWRLLDNKGSQQLPYQAMCAMFWQVVPNIWPPISGSLDFQWLRK